MLGTGNAFAKKYYNTNSLWRTGSFTLMIDCGITAPRALYEANISINDLDAVLITHLHGDHVGGLEEIAFQSKFKWNRKPLLYVPEKLVEPLWEHSLKGGFDDASKPTLHDFFQVRTMKEREPVRIAEGLEVEIMQTDHVPGKDSYSLIINRNIFFSADIKFDPQLLEHMHAKRQCRLFFHDCQLHGPGAVHTTLDELLTLPSDIQEKIYLMHYEDDMEDFIGKTGAMKFIHQQQWYVIDEQGLRKL